MKDVPARKHRRVRVRFRQTNGTYFRGCGFIETLANYFFLTRRPSRRCFFFKKEIQTKVLRGIWKTPIKKVLKESLLVIGISKVVVLKHFLQKCLNGHTADQRNLNSDLKTHS
jgi:hypothetical protein